MTARFVAAALAGGMIALALPATTLAWGETGHAMISRVAAETLPAELPAFVRSAAAVDEIAELGPEEDRIKGAGVSWDADNDPGHFLDIGDDGTVDGVVKLDALPPSMAAYAAALERAGSDPYRAGFVPYTIMDGFERVRKDFAIWRVEKYLGHERERALREDLTLRDIGDWGHFVGDGSQPLHITTHFNGWGDGPNPNHFTQRHIHSYFESTFVDAHARIGAVRADVPAYASMHAGHLLSQAQIAALVGAYLSGTNKEVVPLYQLYADDAFGKATPKAVAFTDAQLARGAAMFRELIALAWENSLYDSVGYPAIAVREILAGKVVPR
jgi:hypothetical protein